MQLSIMGLLPHITYDLEEWQEGVVLANKTVNQINRTLYNIMRFLSSKAQEQSCGKMSHS